MGSKRSKEGRSTGNGDRRMTPEIELTEEQRERGRAVFQHHIDNGMTDNDAAQMTLLHMCLFPDMPLEKMSIFVDKCGEESEPE